MKKIEGSPKNLKQLLQNTKYSIHCYQREYVTFGKAEIAERAALVAHLVELVWNDQLFR